MTRGDEKRKKNIDDGHCTKRFVLLFFLLTRLFLWLSGLHEVFIGSWDAFTTSRSITNDTTATDAFTDIEPEHHFDTDECV